MEVTHTHMSHHVPATTFKSCYLAHHSCHVQWQVFVVALSMAIPWFTLDHLHLPCLRIVLRKTHMTTCKWCTLCFDKSIEVLTTRVQRPPYTLNLPVEELAGEGQGQQRQKGCQKEKQVGPPSLFGKWMAVRKQPARLPAFTSCCRLTFFKR